MDKYGLIGYPLGHSFSQRFFTEKFSKESIAASYSNYEIDEISKIVGIINSTPELKGMNVTIPYKEQVIPYLDSIDPEAQAIGAVNVIKIIRQDDGIHLKGFNTDVVGFQRSIEPFINRSMHRKALILGTGGASKAVARAMHNLGIKYSFVSRSSQAGLITYQQLNQQLLSDYKIIINTSPVGTFPHLDESPDIPYNFLTADHLLYDLVYNPSETQFLQRGKSFGATIKNGSEMLEIQALAAWDIWNK